MNEQPQPVDRRAKMLENVRATAAEQSTPEYRENYLRSCEAHGGDMIEIVAQVRKEIAEREAR